jgi:hypothetical protein
VSRPAPVSRPRYSNRRTRRQRQAIREALYRVLAADHPATVRGVFYRATSAGLVAKTQPEYKVVGRLLAEMRRDGEIPYGWIAGATRWQRKPRTYSSVEEALRNTASTYRRALWDEGESRVEIWCEKEALAGVLVEVTELNDVPLMVTRGYPSLSFLHEAAEAIAAAGQHTHVYYFGDHDPSGRDIDRAIRKGIGESLIALSSSPLDVWLEDEPEEAFVDWATFERVAVTPAQIGAWDLPTRPTKRHPQDHRARRFKGPSVELDAIPSRRLRALAEACIERHVNRQQLEVLRKAEAEERRILEEMAATLDGSQ